MADELREKIFRTISEVMGVNPWKLDYDAKLNTISEWDSFNNLMLISRFQEDLGIEFRAIEIENAQTINSIVELIRKKVLR